MYFSRKHIIDHYVGFHYHESEVYFFIFTVLIVPISHLPETIVPRCIYFVCEEPTLFHYCASINKLIPPMLLLATKDGVVNYIFIVKMKLLLQVLSWSIYIYYQYMTMVVMKFLIYL